MTNIKSKLLTNLKIWFINKFKVKVIDKLKLELFTNFCMSVASELASFSISVKCSKFLIFCLVKKICVMLDCLLKNVKINAKYTSFFFFFFKIFFFSKIMLNLTVPLPPSQMYPSMKFWHWCKFIDFNVSNGHKTLNKVFVTVN